MILSKEWKARALVLALAAALTGGYATFAQDEIRPTPVNVLVAPDTRPPGAPGPQEPGKPGAGKALKTKVFRLKTCAPDDVRQILEGLLDDTAEIGSGAMPGPLGGGGPLGAVPVPGALPGTPGTGAVTLPGTPGGGGFGGGGFGGLGGFGGGLGGLGGGGIMPQPAWRLSVHAGTRSLVVRGSERDLRIASDLVTVLEAPDDKPLPLVKSLRAFRLKHANAEELAQVAEELELETRVVAAPLAKLLIATGAEEALRELADLVKELDVEVKKDDKAPEPKRLLGGPNQVATQKESSAWASVGA